MSNTQTELTKKSDQKGHIINLCDPGWFIDHENFSIENAPLRTQDLKFSGEDLNFAARVLYAESSGALALPLKNDRMNEKEAILNVKYFRLNRKGYPNNSYIAHSFKAVCEAKGQFESVSPKNTKFTSSANENFEKLSQKECTDLEEAIEAINNFIKSGPNPDYCYDNFRSYQPNRPTLPGERVGNSRFWLSAVGSKLYQDQP
ncbi:hypothetical protein [Iodobacter ciconiae]|uniref:Uncharacterized protein n=1 Tax=Iodobacter ciconiae TaxID=2496266 RepID=A0A3S8ZS55_9NEIS|nr:hypothetical protein [Iodobacter ciconiae]AZN36333.1 hypothetical protein EJO50_07425 [Iodobacter ciconiae]